MGGPPIDEIVPVRPESAPAAINERGPGRTRTPVALIPTTSRTATPIANDIRSLGSTTSVPAAAKTPNSRPPIAQPRPERSIERRSRCVISTVSTSALTRRGPGTKSGAMSTRSGAPTTPSPKPMEPCSVAPTQTTAHASSSWIAVSVTKM